MPQVAQYDAGGTDVPVALYFLVFKESSQIQL